MIPDEIKSIKQWSYSYNEQELKRPTHTKYLSGGALDYDTAAIRAGSNLHKGFYVTRDDPYILGDIDHVEDPNNPFANLPDNLANLLVSRPTYSEISPSGKGIRFIYKLPSSADKQALSGNIFYAKELEEKRECQINIAPPWMTITGNGTNFSVSTITEISLRELEVVFSLRYTQGDIYVSKKTIVEKDKLPSFDEVKRTIMSLPLDQNLRIQRAYKKVFRADYQHYDFWLRVLMAVHNYAANSDKLIECYALVVYWSETDPISFESEEDVKKHWRSLSNKDIDISYKTLFRLANANKLWWAKIKKQSKREIEMGIPPQPINSEYENFTRLMVYYNVDIYRDEFDPYIFYVSGDDDIMKRYMEKVYRVKQYYNKYYGPYAVDTVIPAFYVFCQEMGFTGIGYNQIGNFIKTWLAKTQKTINLIKLYFDTPFSKLPRSYQVNERYYEESTVGFIFNALDIDYMSDDPKSERTLYYAYYKAWLMGIARNLFYTYHKHMNNCVLLLTGKEQIRKTSHFRYLLPPFMQEHIAFTPHGFSNENQVRDVIKLSATNVVIVWDEIEQYLNSQTESSFKKIIDNNPQKIIDKYETIPKTIRPIAVYGATSNIRQFKLGQEGSRRLFHIPVKWVRTERLEKVCWHSVINELRKEIDRKLVGDTVPWLLSESQLNLQAKLHAKIRAKNSVDLILEEMFQFNEPLDVRGSRIKGIKSIQTDKSGRCMTTRDIFDTITRYGVNPGQIKIAALEKSLERLCSEYTQTRNQQRVFTSPKCTIYKGRAKQNVHVRWVMPPISDTVKNLFFKRFSQ